MNSCVHIDNKEKDILIIGQGPIQGLDDAKFTEEAIYPINFTQTNERFVLSLHYYGSNSFLFVNATKIYQFKAKNSKIKDYALCLGNLSKDFTIDNMKKTRLNNNNDISDIHKYLMKRTRYKIMFGLIKKIFIGLLTGLVNGSNHTKCTSLSNQKCMTQPSIINLHPNEYSQEFHYYPFAVKLDRCVGSCNTLNDLSNKVCVPNKTKDLNLSVFNKITGKMNRKH